ncbi:hypothetical protein J6590_018552 [Homalodisca vitripennis]|nr:hypothetical protein J6590_096199 [Homalodisca vitripennis]KAG8303087.1 hypothetical protein J6590_018552 [Homalodisca vitripennis]
MQRSIDGLDYATRGTYLTTQREGRIRLRNERDVSDYATRGTYPTTQREGRTRLRNERDVSDYATRGTTVQKTTFIISSLTKPPVCPMLQTLHRASRNQDASSEDSSDATSCDSSAMTSCLWVAWLGCLQLYDWT